MSDINAAQLISRVISLGLVSEVDAHTVWEDLEKTPDVNRVIRGLETRNFLTPLQTSKILKGDNDGYILGGYRLLYKISSGSFGRVYRADDPRSGKVVALKVLRRRWSEDQQRIDLFMREGQMGLTLKHPNIVEVLNVAQDPATGQHFIVMEFVEGGNLKEILAIRHKLDVPDALRTMEELGEGLAYAYSQGITHRDIKLTNVLISSQGTAKLVDFGLAQILAEGGLRKGDDFVERTVDYAGLEKLTNAPKGDIRSDIYFLGTVLFQTLTGRSPIYWTRDKQARMNPNRFQNVEIMKPEELTAPPSVFHLVSRMMTLEPERRYQTPEQMVAAVREARKDLTRKKRGPSSAEEASVFLVEADPKYQEALRNKLKDKGYRVFLAVDPLRALDRFRQRPFDALIVDAATSDDESVVVFERIMQEADRQNIRLAGVVILSQEQVSLAEKMEKKPNVRILVLPVSSKQLHRALSELLTEG